MHNSTDARDCYDAKDGGRLAQSKRPRSWAMFATGFALGLAVLHLGVTRPLTQEFARLQGQMSELQRGVHKLAGKTEQAAKTGELLGALVEQGRQSRAAADALAEIKALHGQLIDAQDATVQARASFAALAELRDEARKAREDSADASAAVEKLANLQERLIGQYNDVVSAQSVLAEYARLGEMAQAESPRIGDARRSLESLIELEARTLSEQDRAGQAAAGAEQLRQLVDRLIAAAEQGAQARDAADELLALKETILCGSDYDRPERARQALDELVKIRERLHGQAESLAAAQAALDGLLSLKDRILAQTADLADAVETLELTTDLHAQLQEAMHQFEGVRRWLVEIVLIEPTVERTMNALKPLAELANLRRLSPSELRQAARVVAGERSARLAEKPRPASGAGPASGSAAPETNADGVELD